jgi:hypothetical protein
MKSEKSIWKIMLFIVDSYQPGQISPPQNQSRGFWKKFGGYGIADLTKCCCPMFKNRQKPAAQNYAIGFSWRVPTHSIT